MIITCEACTKRYVIDAKAVGETGRTVRCAACGNSWRINPIQESVVDLFPENDDVEPSSPTQKNRKKGSLWIGVSILVMALACGLIVGRETVAHLWPQATAIYKHIGLAIDTPGKGLVLQKVHVIPVDENGKRGLIVRGTVVNSTSEVKYLPSLKVRAYGDCAILSWWEKLLSRMVAQKHANPDLCRLHSWKHTLPETRLFPGERAYFESAPKTTAKPVTDLTVSF